LREDWLSSSVWPSTFQQFKSLIGTTIEVWKEQVLEAHIESLMGQLDPSGLAVLSRQVSSQQAAEAREQLLVGMTQSWRGAIDALTLAAERWNVLYQSASKRRQKAKYVSGMILDLYLSAGALRT